MFKPYCPQCGQVRPDDSNAYTCRPCARKGHSYRLVTSDEDRLSRIARWAEYYKDNGFTDKEIAAIPSWQNLNKVPTEAIIEPAHA